MSKSVIYTAIFGGYDSLHDPKAIASDCDYVCFTDDCELESDIWDVRLIDLPVPGDYPRSNRYVKLHPHEYFPEYEYSMYLDGNMVLLNTPNIANILDGFYLVIERHPSNDCIYQEAKECKRSGSGIASEIDRQAGDYRKAGFPEHSGLWANWILLRKHNEPDLIELEKKWWWHIIKYSWRDQLSFPVIFNDYPVKTLPPYYFRYNGVVRFKNHLRKI